ncbi:hypothetical protein LIA77_09475 [Sarocladium implicatum]|nr:hypothetical protein LIA77_09475 [Sarocladium implicatum]
MAISHPDLDLCAAGSAFLQRLGATFGGEIAGKRLGLLRVPLRTVCCKDLPLADFLQQILWSYESRRMHLCCCATKFRRA